MNVLKQIDGLPPWCHTGECVEASQLRILLCELRPIMLRVVKAQKDGEKAITLLNEYNALHKLANKRDGLVTIK